jgi:hypothetical protein
MSNKAPLLALSADEINELDTAALRELADEVKLYSRRTQIAEFKLTAELLAHSGALTTVDKLITAILGAYRATGREPKVENSSYSITVTVWAEDEDLRSSLSYQRRYAIEEAEKEAAEKRAEGNVEFESSAF